MRGDDALDSARLGGAVGGGMTERGVEIARVEAFAEQEDLSRLVSPHARRSRAHHAEEVRGTVAHLLEGDAELVEVERALSLRRRVDTGRIDLLAGALRRELVARDTPQVGRVHEELSLRHAHRQ